MLSESWLSLVIFVFKALCYVVLAYYFLKALAITLALPDPEKRFREALSTTYLIAAAWFTMTAIGVIPGFTQHCIDATGYLFTDMPAEVLQVIGLAGSVILTAFICNFARSLYMLKSLDHATFDPIPEWGQLLASTRARVVEFFVRLLAAGLFLLLEYELKSVVKPPDPAKVISGEITNPFASPGWLGILLYIVLGIWWFVGRSVAGNKMPWTQLVFYCAGLWNSFILALYAGATSEPIAWFMLLSAVVSTVGSIFMIGMVVLEVVKGGFSGWTAHGQQATTSH